MGRGAKKKPTALKVIAGTNRPCRENEHAPAVTELGQILPPPDTLGTIAADKWRELIPHLVKHKILTDVDIHNLENFCQAYRNWRMAQMDIEEHGILVYSASGELKKNPACTAAKEASADMRAFGSNLGLDPASRSRLVVGKGKGGDNPFADL